MKTLFRQKWTYIVILVIAFAVIVVVACCQRCSHAEKMLSIAQQYDKPDDPLMCQKIFSQQVEDISNNLTIWMGVIGAMCTILAVVLGFRQSMDSQRLLEQFREENKKLIKKAKAALEEQRKQIEEKLDEQKYLNTIACINNVLQSITPLCDLRDIKFKGDVPITDSPLIQAMLSSISFSADQALKEYQKIRDYCKDDQKRIIDDQKRIIFHSAMATLQALKNLAQCYEDVVEVASMVQLQSMKERISTQFHQYSEAAKEKAFDPIDPLYDVREAAWKIEDILTAEINNKRE